jgi:HNH endonuclease
MGTVGELLDSAAAEWLVSNPAEAAALAIEYATFSNTFLGEAESAYFDVVGARGSDEATPLHAAARRWVVANPYDEHALYSTTGNRFLWAAEAAFCERLRPLEPIVAPLATSRGYRKQPIPVSLRWAVWERDEFACRYCGVRKFLSVDHIVPESKGGTLELSNLQTLCRSCNSRKGVRAV